MKPTFMPPSQFSTVAEMEKMQKNWGTAALAIPRRFFIFLPQPVRLASVGAGLYVPGMTQVKQENITVS
jgi:hypothetical protein